MVCKNCNAELTEGSKFCMKCGAKVEPEVQDEVRTPQDETQATSNGTETPNDAAQQAQSEPAWNVAQQPQDPSGQQPQANVTMEKVNDMKDQVVNKVKSWDNNQKKKAAIGAGIVVILLIAIVAFANRKTKVDLRDYVDVEFYGEDGKGTAEIDWKDKKLLKAVVEGLDMKKKDREDVWDALRDADYSEVEDIFDDNDLDWDDFQEMMDDVINDTELDEDKHLENGDKVVVTFDYDNKDAKEFGLKFKGKSKKFKVEGLDD